MGTGFGETGKATKNEHFIQWANVRMFKIRKGLLRPRLQNTWQILRLAFSWLSLQNDLKEGFPATAASVLVLYLGYGVRLSGFKDLLVEWSWMSDLTSLSLSFLF